MVKGKKEGEKDGKASQNSLFYHFSIVVALLLMI